MNAPNTILKKDRAPYTTIDNKIITELAAFPTHLGVYIYLYHLPDNWVFHKSHLQKVFDMGIKKLDSILSKLMSLGLLSQSQPRDVKTGQFSGFVMTIHDAESLIPSGFEDHSRSAISAVRQKPSGRKSAAINKEVINKEKSKDINTPLPPAAQGDCLQKELLLPVGLSAQSWRDFEAHRKSMKAPLSETARNRALSQLKKLVEQGQDPERVIDQSIVCGWKGLFAVKQQGVQSNGSRSKAEYVWDLNQQALARELEQESRATYDAEKLDYDPFSTVPKDMGAEMGGSNRW